MTNMTNTPTKRETEALHMLLQEAEHTDEGAGCAIPRSTVLLSLRKYNRFGHAIAASASDVERMERKGLIRSSRPAGGGSWFHLSDRAFTLLGRA